MDEWEEILYLSSPAPGTITQIAPEDLVVGGQYLRYDGSVVRTIDKIEGDLVHWHDPLGKMSASRKAFLRLYPTKVEPIRDTVGPGPDQVTDEDDFSIRDEANALTAFVFRNGFIEELHAGRWSPLLEQPGNSRITDEEMRRLMIEASQKLAQLLSLKTSDPAQYQALVRSYHEKYCRKWKRD